jgi:membrane protein implicated in regulation of membrane protease activity
MPYLWLAVIIIAIVAEAATAQLVSIWFVVGGIGALIANLCGADLWVQVVVFILLTVLSLICTRPFIKKLLSFKKEETNAGRYIGENVVVITEINNTLGVGQVKVRGSIWAARSEDNSIVRVGKSVIVKSIEGVKLIVEVHK